MTTRDATAATAPGPWWGALFVMVAALATPTSAGAGQPAATVPPPDITVRGDDGTYTVAARFSVAQTLAVARAVLSDYEAIPDIIPDMRSSVVVQRHPHLLVAQEAVSKFGLFSRTIHLLLEVSVDDHAITFVDRSGQSFTAYHGAWRLEAHDGGTAISYALTARPAFSVPGFLITRVMSRDARVMIERLSRAIVARPAP